MERYDYQTSFRVFEWETDKNGIMTTGSLLRRVQQLGTDHCESIGLNDAVYERCGAVFLMAKSVVEWKRPVRAGETLQMQTAAGTAQRAVYPRVAELIDEKLQAPLVPSGLRRALYTECDRNGHLNNTKYADWLYDMVPCERWDTEWVKRCVIHYHHEIPLNTEVPLAVGSEGTLFAVQGTREGRKCFDAQLEFGTKE